MGSAAARKIFLPLPVYLVSSLVRSSASLRVGSSEGTATVFFVGVAVRAVEVRRVVGLAEGTVAVAAGGGLPAAGPVLSIKLSTR